MSQKASATAIGAFVLGAVALIIAGLLMFGSGKFLKEFEYYVLVFRGNVKGLTVGAPVSFRGVRFGSVTDIELIWDVSTDEAFVEVLVEIDGEAAFRDVESQPGVDRMGDKEVMSHLIDDLGMRAKLAPVSLVTGQLYIEFGFFPGTEATLYGFNPNYDEFPTLPSTIEELEGVFLTIARTLKDLPMRELVDKLVTAVDGINSLVHDRHTQDTPRVLHEALENARILAARLDAQVTPLAQSLTQTSKQANAAFADARQMMRSGRGEIVHLAESLEETANRASDLLKKADQLVSSVDGAAIDQLIQELRRAAVSIRVFADYLSRHPEALLRGKDR